MMMSVEKTPSLKYCALIILSVILLMWAIKAIEIIFGLDLGVYGVHPGQVTGLAGILFAPLIHGSFEHLFANTLPLFILGTALLYSYPKAARYTFPIIYLGSGIGVWLFARDSYHIGASGLTHGMMFFLFIAGIIRKDKPSIAIALMVFFLYGSMIWSIFPGEAHISFESHFFGALVGMICAIIFRNMDARKTEKKYSWELEDKEALEIDADREDGNNSISP